MTRLIALVVAVASALAAPGALAQQGPEVIDWKELVPPGTTRSR